MNNLSDFELIKLFKDGNNKAFEAIVERYQAHVYSYVLSITKNPDYASDILQDVFVRAFKKIKGYNDENKLKNWLFVMARNLTMDFYRKNSRPTVPLESKDEDDFSLIDSLADNSPQPIDIAAANSSDEAVNNALRTLSADERELIFLKDSMTFKEISEMQNKPLGTLLSKFNRALAKIKKYMKENEQEVYNEFMR